MTHVLDWLLPYRFLLKWRQRDAIELEAKVLLPAPYDAARIEAELRAPGMARATGTGLADVASFGRRLSTPGILNLDSAVQEARGTTIAAGEMGAYLGEEILRGFARIDDLVYHGISRMSSDQIDNLGDLCSKLRTYEHGFWSGLPDAGLHKLAGHVAEIAAAEHLAAGGLNVVWPEVSNQPGWDLLVGGHEVNVKLVADVSSLAGHFAAHPEIPVVVPGDALNIPHDAIHFDATHGINDVVHGLTSGHDHVILVDDALSHAETMHHVAQATDSALGSADMVHAHFPWVTMVFSGWREVKLLDAAKTDAGTALKNIALDIGGTATGGFAGAKSGAVLGGLIGGPVGAGIGAILLGVAGAVIGRGVSGGIKRRPLEHASEAMRRAQSALRTAAEEENRRIDQEFAAARDREAAQLREAARLERHKVEGEADELRAWRRQMERLGPSEAGPFLALADRELQELILSVEHQYRSVAWWRRWFWPDARTIGSEVALRSLATLGLELQAERTNLSATGWTDRSHLLDLLARAGLVNTEVRESLRVLYDSRLSREKLIRESVLDATRRIAESRAAAFRTLEGVLKRLRDEARERLAAHLATCAECAAAVTREAEKLGLA